MVKGTDISPELNRANMELGGFDAAMDFRVVRAVPDEVVVEYVVEDDCHVTVLYTVYASPFENPDTGTA